MADSADVRERLQELTRLMRDSESIDRDRVLEILGEMERLSASSARESEHPPDPPRLLLSKRLKGILDETDRSEARKRYLQFASNRFPEVSKAPLPTNGTDTSNDIEPPARLLPSTT